MSEPQPKPQPDYTKPQEVSGPDLNRVLREAEGRGYYVARLTVRKGANYRVEFHREPHINCPPTE